MRGWMGNYDISRVLYEREKRSVNGFVGVDGSALTLV
jgi:hypothetical protein